MSAPPFHIPGLGHAKPNEVLPAENFAPDLLAAAASINENLGFALGTGGAAPRTSHGATKDDAQEIREVNSSKNLTQERLQDRAAESREDPMEVDRVTISNETVVRSAAEIKQESGDSEPHGPVDKAGTEDSNDTMQPDGQNDEAQGHHVTDALEAVLDGLMSAAARDAEQSGEQVAEPVNGADGAEAGEQAEWEADSSPYESSSESDSSDTSDEEDSDEEGGYQLLGIEETARLLMAEIDGEGGGKGKGSGAGQVRTKNEKPEEILPKPEVTITPDMKIESLGTIESIVENTVVIKSRAPGEVQALDTGSVLCRADRTVIGALAETLGNVRNPLYTVGFANEEEIKSLELAVGTEVFYSLEHAKYVFTQALREMKGSDASNLHDEEVGADEMEFSDDEKEAEYKKQLRAKKRGAKAGQGAHERNGKPHPLSNSSLPPSAADRDGSLNYDEDEDGPYKPLSRPQSFSQGSSSLPSLPPRPGGGFSAPRGGHGGRGSPRGGRGDFRGRSRGGRGGDRRYGRGRGGSDGRGGPDHSFGYDGAVDAVRPSSYGTPPQPPNAHLPPPPYGMSSPPQASASPWQAAAPAPYVPPPTNLPYPPAQSQAQLPLQPPAPSSYQNWGQGQAQPYYYPQQAVPQPVSQQAPPTAGYSQPTWPAAGVPPPPVPPTGGFANPAFYAAMQGQQGQQQGQQPYWGRPSGS
ncbi:hypothetical protein VTK73DRAFT_2039 [Phialemonium thermophilum]|uniref:H/ACA ribonucleoprotein complex non-core subunit NAF1 n=1 Tax=Phialemonium thermophilum TaxID=223376 RepID=A0ABR3X7F1_9PEZI